jgi:hypothetical protein
VPNHHPSRSGRGCALCKPYKRRGAGPATKDPVVTRRRLDTTAATRGVRPGVTDPGPVRSNSTQSVTVTNCVRAVRLALVRIH